MAIGPSMRPSGPYGRQGWMARCVQKRRRPAREVQWHLQECGQACRSAARVPIRLAQASERHSRKVRNRQLPHQLWAAERVHHWRPNAEPGAEDLPMQPIWLQSWGLHRPVCHSACPPRTSTLHGIEPAARPALSDCCREPSIAVSQAIQELSCPSQFHALRKDGAVLLDPAPLRLARPAY